MRLILLLWLPLALPAARAAAQPAPDACRERAASVQRYLRADNRATRARLVRQLPALACRPAAAPQRRVCQWDATGFDTSAEGMTLRGRVRCAGRVAAGSVRWIVADQQGTPLPMQAYVQADDEGALLAVGDDVLQLLPRHGASDGALQLGCSSPGCYAGAPRLGGSIFRALPGAEAVRRYERDPGVVVLAEAPSAERCVALGRVGRCELPAQVFVDGQRLAQVFHVHYLWDLPVEAAPAFERGQLANNITRLDRTLRRLMAQERVEELDHLVELLLEAQARVEQTAKPSLIARTRRLVRRARKYIADVWTSRDFSAAQQRALLVKLGGPERPREKKKE